MAQVIDAFLFFQELDLLEIRLEYMAPSVDRFVILEAAQTFTGKPKDFCLEANFDRFKRFAHKIHYYKVTDRHATFSSIIDHLGGGGEAHSKVKQLLLAHTHYPRDEIQWVLDTYHRECLHLALAEVADDNDTVIFSDLDEIPDVRTFPAALRLAAAQPRVFQQHEFRYFLNCYLNSDWLGSIVGRYGQLKHISLNTLRMDSKVARHYVAQAPIIPGGWHFTSCGGIEAIRRKIESWGHQEFNTPAVMANLERNIRTGQDIFGREHGTILIRRELTDELFDPRLAQTIRRFPDLVSGTEIEKVQKSWWKSHILRGRFLAGRIVAKLSRLFSASNRSTH